MVFGPLIGIGVGALAGAALGALIFNGDRPEDMLIVTEAGDRNENLRCPAVPVIDDKVRNLIPMTPEWTVWPDFNRWVMPNRLVRLMWPKLTSAILTDIVNMMKPMFQEMFKQMGLTGIVEDITLGWDSLLLADHHHEELLDKALTLGDWPVRVAGMKVYRSGEDDTCTFETPVMWGSNMVFDLVVFLKLGPLQVAVPVHVSNVQFKVLSRLTLHMVDTFPCLGGANLTLLSLPHWDATVKLFGCPIDVMAMPGVKLVADKIVEWAVKQLLLYPNSVTVPLMTNYGLPPEPKGMLYVRVVKMEGFHNQDMIGKQDPYVKLEVRWGRGKQTTTKSNTVNPVFNEDFFMVVDDVEKQVLRVTLWDKDHLMPTDEFLGETMVFFTEEKVERDIMTGGEQVVYEPTKWVQTGQEEHLVLDIVKEKSTGNIITRKISRLVSSALFKGDDEEGPPELPGGYDRNMRVAKTRKQLRLEAEAKARTEKYTKDWQEAAKKRVEARKKREERLQQGMTDEEAEALFAQDVGNALEELEWEWVDEEAEKAEEEAKAAEAKRVKSLTRKQRAEEAAKKKAEDEAKKAAEEEVVLVEEKRRLRGNGPKLTGMQVAGKLHLVVRFLPFERPKCDDDIEMTPVPEGLAAYVPFAPPKPRVIATNVSDLQKGLLTVKLLGASGLGKPGQLVSPDPYVEIVLVDCDPARPDDRQRSRTCKNDSSPKWGDLMDFVMVSAGSILNITVYDKELTADVALGKVQVPVMDVVRNGSLRGSWPLQEAESGVIDMKMTWQNCYVNLDD